MKYAIFILMFLFILASVETHAQDQLDEMFRNAIKAYDADSLNQADLLFGQILADSTSQEISEMRAACYFWRGCARYGLNDYGRAKSDLEHGLDIMEKHQLKTDEYFYCAYLMGLCDYRESEFSDLQLLRQAEDEFQRAFDGIRQHMRSNPFPDFRERLLRPLLEKSLLYAIDSKLHRGMLESEQPLREALKLCDTLESLAPAAIDLLRTLQVIRAEIYLQLSKCCSYAIQNRDQSRAQADSALQIINPILVNPQPEVNTQLLGYLKALCYLHLAILGDIDSLQVAEGILNLLAAPPDWQAEVNLRRGHTSLLRGDYGNSIGYYSAATSLTRRYWRGWAYFLKKDFIQSRREFDRFINTHANTHDRRLRILVNDARFRWLESEYFGCVASPVMQSIVNQVEQDLNADNFPSYLSQCERSIFNPDIEMVAKRKRQFGWICGPSPFPPPCDTEHLEFGKEFLKRGMTGCGPLNIDWARQTFDTSRTVMPIARLLYAITLFAQGNSRGAINELSHVADWNLADEKDYTLGRIYESIGNDSQAITLFQPLSTRGSVCATYWMMLCHLHLSQFAEAARDYWRIVNTVNQRATGDECVDAWFFWREKAEDLLRDLRNQFQIAHPGQSLNVQQYRNQVQALGQDNTTKAQQPCYFLLDNLYYDETLLQLYRDQLLAILKVFDDPFITLSLETVFPNSVPKRIPDAWFDLKINFPSDFEATQIPTNRIVFVLNGDTLGNVDEIQTGRFARDGLERGRFSELMIHKTGFYPGDLPSKFYMGVKETVDLRKAIKYEIERRIEIPIRKLTEAKGEGLRWIHDIDNSSSNDFFICGGGGFYRYDANWSNGRFYPIPNKSLPAVGWCQDAVYCADLESNLVIRMHLDETIQESHKTTVLHPSDICCHLGRDGIQYVYVVESRKNRVLKYTAGLGSPEAIEDITWGGDTYRLNSPDGIWVTSDDVIYVADCGNHRVLRFDDTDRIYPFKLKRNLWIGRIDGMPADITSDGRYRDGEFYFPTRLLVDGGYIYVSDLSGRIQKFDENGNFLQVVGQFSAPFGLAIDGSRLYVVERDLNRIEILQKEWDRTYTAPRQ